MSDSNVILSAYSFLAALTENQNDLYNHVYIPICKRALSSYNSEYGGKAGKWSDIHEIILKEYGINTPQVVIKQLINSVYKVLSNNEKKKAKFEVFNKGETFQIEKYTFLDLEDKYKKGVREANALQEAFNVYLLSKNTALNDVPSIHEFLEKNKIIVATFFNNSKVVPSIDKSFFFHLEFFKYIEENNNGLYEIAQNQYLGSLVAGYFEAGLSLDSKFSSTEIYYLDTPIILRALDLQKEEEAEATKQLLDLIINTGGKIKVLSITIAEVQNVLENTIEHYDSSLPSTTINDACLRLGKNRAWLMQVQSDLEMIIKEKLNASIEPILSSFIEKYRHTPDVKMLQSTRMKTTNALHDVIAYMHIRKLRDNSVGRFQKAKYWFLSTNTELLKFNRNHLSGKVPEIVLSDSLTSLLWLKNPVKLEGLVKKTGLNILLAATLNEEIASKELINEFAKNVKSIANISNDDYKILLESVAYQSAKNIEKFNELFAIDKEGANEEAHKIIKEALSKKIDNSKAMKDSQQQIAEKEKQNQELGRRLLEIEQTLSNVIKKQNADVSIAEKKEKQKKWLIIILSILVIILLLLLIDAKFGFIPVILNKIISLSGLFAFGSFIINLIKLFR